MPQDIVRVIRIVQYVGPRDLVEEQLSKAIHGTRSFSPKARMGRLDLVSITAITLGDFPETLPSWYTDSTEVNEEENSVREHSV